MNTVVHTDELDMLIIRAQADDLDAFGTIVQRFQDMAVGYAYSILGDHECPELYELAELDVMKMSDSQGLMRLAQLAVEARSEEDKEILRQRIDEFKATAEYETLADAMASQQQKGS